MAVVDKFAATLLDANGNAIKQNLKAILGQGVSVGALFSRVELTSGDSINSEYMFWRDLSANLIPLALMLACDSGLTGWSDIDIGLFNPSKDDGQTPGDVISGKVDYFADGLTVASEVASLNPKTALDGLSNLGLDDYEKALFEHAGHDVTNKKGAYGIGMTAKAVGATSGSVHALLLFGQVT